MKLFKLIIIFTFVLGLFLYAGDNEEDEIIRDIREKYRDINANIKTFKKESNKVDEESSEGGLIDD